MKLYEHQRINRQDLRGHCKEVNMVEITKIVAKPIKAVAIFEGEAK